MARDEEDVHDEDEEIYEDEEGLADEQPQGFEAKLQAWIRKSPAFAISAVVHLVLILLIGSIAFMEAQPEIKSVFVAKREKKTTPYNPEKKRALEKKPEINRDKVVEKPVVNLNEMVEQVEIPKGTSMNNLTNKELDSDNAIDAMGVGAGGSGAFGDRNGKVGLLAEGGSEGTESAVQAALLWLWRHQSPDGRWDADGYQRKCDSDHEFPGQCFGQRGSRKDSDDWQEVAAWSEFDIGVTGLALLAFLGNGHTHKFSPDERFRETVKMGINWLKSQQADDGSIGFKHEPPHGESIYNHALAMMALCEAYAVTRDFTLKKPCQAAVDFAVKAQNQVDGNLSDALGWKYGIKTGLNDTSVTGWMVFALKSAEAAKLDVPPVAFRGALNWFDQATDERTGLVGYEGPDGFSAYIAGESGSGRPYYDFERVPCMTAVAIICRIKAGQEKDAKPVKQGLKILMDSVPRADQRKYRNLYYWYYGTFSVFNATTSSSSEWRKWNEAMQEALLTSQQQGSAVCLDGSWDPDCEWGLAGGRVYATAIGALTLEVYYRYHRAE